MECLAGDTVVLPNLGTEWRESPSTYVTDDLGELEEGGGTLMGINVGEKIHIPQFHLRTMSNISYFIIYLPMKTSRFSYPKCYRRSRDQDQE